MSQRRDADFKSSFGGKNYSCRGKYLRTDLWLIEIFRQLFQPRITRFKSVLTRSFTTYIKTYLLRSSDPHKIVLRGYLQKCPIAFEIIFMAYIAKHKTEITQKDFVLLVLWSWIITVLPHFIPMALVQLKKSIIKLRCEILIIQRSKDHYNIHKVSDKTNTSFSTYSIWKKCLFTSQKKFPKWELIVNTVPQEGYIQFIWRFQSIQVVLRHLDGPHFRLKVVHFSYQINLQCYRNKIK